MPILKFPFNGCEKITQHYSQAGQELFVLGLLNGKNNGTYLEIGSSEPILGSNTYILESLFGWRGVGIEIQETWVESYQKERTNPCIIGDATNTDYLQLLHNAGIFETDIDYVSLDCDPPVNTFNALQLLPFDTHRFSIITFEHDSYQYGTEFKYRSRDFLISKGYELLVSNVSAANYVLGWGDFEDWWVHPELIDPSIISRFKNSDDTIKDWNSYLFF